MCHLILIGLPLLALSAFWFLPFPVALPAFAVLIGITLALYGYLMKSARRPVMTGMEAMRHALGQVRGVNGETAAIWVNSELWSATSGEPLHEGDRVEVVGMEGLQLRVRKFVPGASDAGKRNCHGA